MKVNEQQTEEICKSYREAKDRAYQIQIMADLNGCRRKDIEEILLKEGLDVEDAKGKGKRKSRFTDAEIMQAYKDAGEVMKVAAENIGLSYSNFVYRMGRIKEKGVQPCDKVDITEETNAEIQKEKRQQEDAEREAEKKRVYRQHEENSKKYTSDMLEYGSTYARIDSILSRVSKSDSIETVEASLTLALNILRDAVYKNTGKRKE